jgi:diacylglycerol kinase family enzyme
MRGHLIVLNAASGRGIRSHVRDHIRALYAAAGVPAEIELVASGRSAGAAMRAAGARHPDVLVAGGGDGTVSAAAAVLAGTGIPLAVLPLGTRNHFARDLGVPLELDAAVAAAIGGVPRRIDVGEVNGEAFVNNASIGVYPAVVRLRQQYQGRGAGKWLPMAWAALAVTRRRPFLGVRLIVDGAPMLRRTPFVFVGNNDYRMEGVRAAQRETLDGGALAVYVMNASGRRSLLWLAFQVLAGRTRELGELDHLHAAEVTVETRRRHIQVARDGEVTTMAAPLTFRIRPKALTVLVPAEANAHG